MLDSESGKKVLTRLKRVEGQISALQRMVHDDASCVDLLMQISAAQGALGATGQVILAKHIETCVSDAFDHGGKQERDVKIQELMDVFARYNRIGAR